MRIGEPVLLRSIYGGCVRSAVPHRFVGMWGDRYGLFCQPGSLLKSVFRRPDGNYLDEWVTTTPARDGVWARGPVLRFARPGDRVQIEVLWDREWELCGWYLNLQAPLRVNGRFFDTCDLALDVRVFPAGDWTWKDEDDLALALELGMLDADDAASLRAEAEGVIAQEPWPTGWEDWRPPPQWAALALPPDWNAISP